MFPNSYVTLNICIMKSFYILLTFLVASASLFAQIATDPKITKELTDWDPVRGQWLAESMQAVASNQVVPDRTFPEQFTPSEMFSQVPVDRQQIIRDRIQENQQNAAPTEQQNWDRMNRFVNRPSCNLTMGRTYGDPHIKTFDGKTFSFQTVGEFVLAKSTDGNLEVQARQKPQSDEISLNTATAMNVSGDKVSIYAMDAPDGNSATPLRINGQTIFLKDEMYYLPRGGTVEDKGNNYIITWPTGEKVEAKMSTSGRMKFINISVHVYPCSSLYMGVLGNANGNPNDDFGDRGGMLASSTIFDPMGTNSRNNPNLEKEHLAYISKDFARYHRVTNQTSLFDYGFGQSTWSFTDESFPRVYLTLADLSNNDRNNAQRRCEQQGISREDMAGCIFDVGHANIAPTPRPVLDDRTAGGRPLPPVDGRTPNVNRTTATIGTREMVDSNPPSNPTPKDPSGTATSVREQGNNAPAPTPQPIVISNGKDAGVSKESTSKENTEVISKPVSKPVSAPILKPVETEKPQPAKPVVVPVTKKPDVETRPVEPQSKPAPAQRPASAPESKPSKPLFGGNSSERNSSSRDAAKPSSTPVTAPSAPARESSSKTVSTPSRGSTSIGGVKSPR